MNNKLKVLLSVVAIGFVIVGCGSSGSSSGTTSFSNAKISDGSHMSGYYYGENVLFGDTPIVGSWKYYIGDNEPITISYGEDGISMFITPSYRVNEELYGVSDDAQKLSYPAMIIVGKSSNNCYSTVHQFTGATIEFCKIL